MSEGNGGWSGRKVTRLKAYVIARDQGICCRCGLPGADSSDHWPTPKCELDRSEWFDPGRLAAAHLACNLKAGAKLGAVRLAAKRSVRYEGASRDW